MIKELLNKVGYCIVRRHIENFRIMLTDEYDNSETIKLDERLKIVREFVNHSLYPKDWDDGLDLTSNLNFKVEYFDVGRNDTINAILLHIVSDEFLKDYRILDIEFDSYGFGETTTFKLQRKNNLNLWDEIKVNEWAYGE